MLNGQVQGCTRNSCVEESGLARMTVAAVRAGRWTARRALVAVVFAWAFGVFPTWADESAADAEDTSWHEKTDVAFEPAREAWAGAETFARVWSLYTGATYAPFGNLRQDGLRLRAVSTLSRFNYEGMRYADATGTSIPVAFEGGARGLDLLLGYQVSTGGLTAKLFAGWTRTSTLIAPYDPATRVQGPAQGAKVAVELWYNFGSTAWTALDVAVAKPHRFYSIRSRTGWRFGERFSAGPEIAAYGHEESDTRRLGLFVRYDDQVNEVSLSGGWSHLQGGDTTHYATAQWLRRF